MGGTAIDLGGREVEERTSRDRRFDATESNGKGGGGISVPDLHSARDKVGRWRMKDEKRLCSRGFLEGFESSTGPMAIHRQRKRATFRSLWGFLAFPR